MADERARVPSPRSTLLTAATKGYAPHEDAHEAIAETPEGRAELIQQILSKNSRLVNPDLVPCSFAARTWTQRDFLALWIALCFNPAAFMFGSSLLYMGLNWWQSLLAIVLGSVLTCVPLCLNSVAGVRYGISFPVLVRSSFGTRGAVWLALSRGVIAIAWLSLQVWVGSLAFFTAMVKVFPGFGKLGHVDGLGIDGGKLLCLVGFIAAHAVLIWHNIPVIRKLQRIAVPVLGACLVALLVWSFVATDSVASLLRSTNAVAQNHAAERGVGWAFASAVTATVSVWSTMVLNIADLSRFGQTVRGTCVGQVIGLPVCQAFTCVVGMFCTGAAYERFGEELWNPADILAKFSPAVTVLGSLAIVLSLLVVNLAANLVSPANDIANAWPAVFSFRVGGVLSCACAFLMLPWKLFADPHGYVTQYLVGYSILTGAIAGIMIADFFVERRQHLVVAELYEANGMYSYFHGFHLRAFATMAVVCAWCVPGFALEVRGGSPSDSGDGWRQVYALAWFVCFGGSVGVYLALARFLA